MSTKRSENTLHTQLFLRCAENTGADAAPAKHHEKHVLRGCFMRFGTGVRFFISILVCGVFTLLGTLAPRTPALAVETGTHSGPPPSGTPLVFQPGQPDYILTPHVRVLIDVQNALSAAQAMAPQRQADYTELRDGNRRLKKEPITYWARFTLRRESPRPPNSWTLVLKGDFFSSSQSNFYYQYRNADGDLKQGKVVAQRELPQVDNSIAVNLPIPPPGAAVNGEWTYYIRYSCIGQQAPDFRLVNTYDFLLRQKDHALHYGAYYGYLLAIAIVTLVFFIVMHERSLLYFLFWLLSVVFFFALENNAFDFILEKFTFWQQAFFFSITVGLMLFMFSAFSRAFLMTSVYSPQANTALRLYGFCALLVPPMPFLKNFELYFALIQGLVLIAPFLFIAAGIHCLYRGFKSARFYIVALAAFPIGGALQMLAHMEYIPDSPLVAHGSQIGAGVLVLLLSLALGDRMRALRQAKEAAESAKHESELRFRAIFDQTFQYIALIEPDGRVLEINRAALEEASEEDKCNSIGHYIWERPNVQGTEREIQLRSAIRQAASGRFVRFQQSFVAPQKNNLVHVDFSFKPVFNPHGEVTLLIAEARDISELKNAQERIFQSEKLSALGRIVAGVAHEINNPNNFIYFNIPVLREYLNAVAPILEKWQEADGPLLIMNQPLETYLNDMYQLLDDMELGSSRIASIVSELRNYLRSNESDEKQELQVEEVVDNALTLAGNQVRKMVKTLGVDVKPNLPPIHAHPARIEQVLINLLVNAAQAADKEDSRITLTATPSETNRPGVIIRVEDNGSGIAEDLRDKVFEPFFSTKRGQSGTGQGLAISRNIVEEHGGELTLRSVVGAGTLFTIFLPAAPKPAQSQKEADA